MEEMSHDDWHRRLMALPEMPWAQAVDFFVLGVSGRFPRGRAVLLDYLRVSHMRTHSFQGIERCDICSLSETVQVRAEAARASAAAGHSGNEVIESVLPRWEEAVTLPPPEATEPDRDVLRALLDGIAEAPVDETPGQLEKRIAKAKLLPKTEKYKRHGILQTLAECGVLPNGHCAPLIDGPRAQSDWLAAHHGLRGAPRSDIVLPLAGWCGKMGVDWARAREVFEL